MSTKLIDMGRSISTGLLTRPSVTESILNGNPFLNPATGGKSSFVLTGSLGKSYIGGAPEQIGGGKKFYPWSGGIASLFGERPDVYGAGRLRGDLSFKERGAKGPVEGSRPEAGAGSSPLTRPANVAAEVAAVGQPCCEPPKETTETIVERLWAAPGSSLVALKTELNGIFQMVTAKYDAVVVSPHFAIPGLPIDADSFSFSTGAYHALEAMAKKHGREVVFTADPGEVKHDGKFYIVLMPVSDVANGFSPEDRKLLTPLLSPDIKSSLIVGDTRFMPVEEFMTKDGVGFNYMVNVDHHHWPQVMLDKIGKFDSVFLLDNDVLFKEGNSEAYAAGALTADLLSDGVDPFYDLVKMLSLYGDTYDDDFPKFTREHGADGFADLAETLGFAGTYLMSWDPDGKSSRKMTMYKRSVLIDIHKVISSCKSYSELKERLDAYYLEALGQDFVDFCTEVLGEVNRSIAAFIESDDLVYRYATKSPHVLAIHKCARKRLEAKGLFGKRALLHYNVYQNGDGNQLNLDVACDSRNKCLNVSEPCVHGPGDISWGGGHPERAGVMTEQVKDPAQVALLNEWWGPERDSQKVLDFIVANLRKQRETHQG